MENLLSVGAYVRVWGVRRWLRLAEEEEEVGGEEGVFSSLRIESTYELLATNDFQPLVSIL